MASEDFTPIAARLFPDARISSVWRLTGGVSADVHALALEETNGDRRTVVVRQHATTEWKPRHEQIAAMEYELLGVLYRLGIPVPEPLLLDTTGQLLAGPFLVMAFVEGSNDVPAHALDTCLETMATTLAGLHDLPSEVLPELPPRTDPLPELFDYLPELPEWRSLREYLSQLHDSAYLGRPALLHGDFWPGNLLWQDDRLTAILDWEDAALGEPVADVAGCRLELLWEFGSRAVDHFTQAYARKHPLDIQRLALWEVFVASAAIQFMHEWDLEPSREAMMRKKADVFVREAARKLLFKNQT